MLRFSPSKIEKSASGFSSFLKKFIFLKLFCVVTNFCVSGYLSFALKFVFFEQSFDF